nr:lytic murein transglycosylase [Mesobacterium pallidum]
MSQTKTTAGLRRWLTEFRETAQAEGIDAGLYDRAVAGLSYDEKVVSRDRNQSEFTKTIWDYLDTAVSDLRVQNGRDALARQRKTLEAIEARYGVPKEIVTAIWGLESAYGSFRGGDDTLQSLATLAYDGRRAAFFEGELLAALTILNAGDTTPENLRGSWAGAMGHTQFMPSSFLRHAVDWTGDGRRDIWGEDPADALASTAAYLKKNGWQTGVPWGVEVTLPDGFDYAAARRDNRRMPSDWAAEGVLGVDGKPVPNHGPASVLLPAGHLGVAFLVFDNFKVLESYNTADAYVIGVGHLADRIAGGAPFKHGWPREDRVLTLDERLELQRRLTEAGFDTEKIDGKIGPLTIGAVRQFQQSIGWVPDGYASLRVLTRLREG